MKSRKQSTMGAVVELFEQRRMLSAGDLAAAHAFGGWDEQDAGQAVAVDAQGNSYVTGFFRGNVDVDPSKKGVYYLKSGASQAGFIAKYSPAGKLLWAKRMVGTGNVMPTQVKVGPTGNLFIGGIYDGQFGFQGAGRETVLAGTNGDIDIFLMCLRSDGRLVWAGNVGGDMDDSMFSMDVGADGDVYYAGAVRLEGDLDPGQGVQSIETRGVDDTFVSRVRGKDGKLVWAKVYGEQDSSEPVTGVVADGNGGVYVTGTYYRTVEFDREKSAFTLDEISDNDIYLGHLVSNGGKTASGATWDWLMPIGGGEDEVGGGIALGPTGDIYLTGTFGDRVEFQPGVAASALTSIGERDAFVARYSRKGKLVWARQIGGDDAEILGKVVAVDSSGAVYAAGDFNEKVYITQGRRTVTLNAEDKDSDAPPMNWMDPTDVYVTKFTASGKLAYAKHIGGEDAGMTVNGIAAAANGDVTLTGGYAGTADFNPGRATFIRYTSDEKREMDAWWVKLLG